MRQRGREGWRERARREREVEIERRTEKERERRGGEGRERERALVCIGSVSLPPNRHSTARICPA